MDSENDTCSSRLRDSSVSEQLPSTVRADPQQNSVRPSPPENPGRQQHDPVAGSDNTNSSSPREQSDTKKEDLRLPLQVDAPRSPLRELSPGTPKPNVAPESDFNEPQPGTSRLYPDFQCGATRSLSEAEYQTLLELGAQSGTSSAKVSAIDAVSDDGDGLEELITLQNNSCHMCNGFYAQNHGEVVCSICHAFLFPHFAPDLPLKSLDEDSDSDSGNDEPQDSQSVLNICTRTFLRDYRRLGFNSDVVPNITPLDIYQDPQNLSRDGSRHASLDTLPTEVLLIIMRYLDEMSVWSLSRSNKRFSVVISQLVSAEKWKRYTLQKWQFLNRDVSCRNWYHFYTKMMQSSFCFRCVQAMSDHEIVVNDENPWRENRLRTESRSLHLDPLEGIWATPLDELRYHWQACIEGPAGSPYEGGKFYLYLQVPYTYPMSPPVVRFITKIFHPNVSRHGDIGIDSIQHNWSLALTVGKVLISIQSLLTDPYCVVCMEPEIGKLYIYNRPAFEEQASNWTWKYAMNELKY